MSSLAELPGEVLPRLARAAIGERLGVGESRPPAALDPKLLVPAASFVTLTLEGSLRGCVGSLEVRRPLAEDVEANACAAAFEDPRFPVLGRSELAAVRVEVSVLGPTCRLVAADEAELARELVPGEDGVILVAGDRRATFLPQVWDALPETLEFIDQLRRKAGLAPDYWRLSPSFFRYRVRKWKEK